MSFNRAIVIGRLTKDPELRMTKTGKEMCAFSLAVDSGYGPSKEVMFLDFTCFENVAKNLAKYVRKGDNVLAEGTIKVDKFNDATGNPRMKYKVLASRIEFLGGSKKSGDVDKTEAVEYPKQDNFVEDDDLPF